MTAGPIEGGRAAQPQRGPPAGIPCILVFGAAVRPDGRPSGVLRRRIEGAYSAWHRLPGARILVTGGRGRHGPAEALVMRERLLAKGVPEADLLVDAESGDTFESALAAARILRGLPGLGRVWVCTSAFHAPRCRVLMRLLGFRTGVIHIPPAESPLARVTGLYWILREIPALPWDALLVLLHRLRRRWRSSGDGGRSPS